MATVIRTVHNNLTSNIELKVPGYDAQKLPVVVPASSTVDLFTVLNAEQLSSIQIQLAGLVADGALSAVALADVSTVALSGAISAATGAQTINSDITINGSIPSAGLIVNGKIVARRDNGTGLALRGPQHTSEGAADVSSYSGIFNNDGYDVSGTLKTRVIHGANVEMDLEIQSPHQLRLCAADGTQTDPEIWISSQNNVKINTRNDAEGISSKQLLIDRVDTATVGAGNTSDVNLNVNSGNLRLLAGNVTGAVVLPLLTDAERGALTPVKGMLIMNADTSLLNVYDGSAWKAVDVSAV